MSSWCSTHLLIVYAKAISSCVSEDFPPKYEVVTAGDYVKSRLEATYFASSVALKAVKTLSDSVAANLE